jgi:uncharacterized repeat protein (TIGR03803 family)
LRKISKYAAALALAACGANNVPPATSPISNAVSFRLPASVERVLYSFPGGSGGGDPLDTLITDRRGALYGTTAFGGTGSCFEGCGTVFKLTRSGKNYVASVLYSFLGPSSGDGNGPAGGVVADTSGTLYGTTEYGGDSAGDGIVFKLTPAGSKYSETVLHRFNGGRDGSAPLASLTLDASGNLFGSTLLGGGASACGTNGSGGFVGCGTIFELHRSGPSYKERVLYRFQSGSDGATPGSPPVLAAKDLYGTTATGGGSPSCGGAPINPGCGTAYELTPKGKSYAFRVTYAFAGAPNDAANAFGGLAADGSGSFCGTSQYGGAQNVGSVFRLTPSGSKYRATLLHSFAGGSSDGSYPLAVVAVNVKKKMLYGTTQYGGSSANAGTVFAIRSSGGGYKVLLSFENAVGGEYPIGGILAGPKGLLYGTTSYGGSASGAGGTVFALR